MAAATLTALLEGPAQRTYLSVAEARTASRPSVRWGTPHHHLLCSTATFLASLMVGRRVGLCPCATGSATVGQRPAWQPLQTAPRCCCVIEQAVP
jgi:hypothetical protein